MDYLMFYKKLIRTFIICCMLSMIYTTSIYSQDITVNNDSITDNGQNEDDIYSVRVGIVSNLITNDPESIQNRVSVTVENILRHYIELDPNHINTVDLTVKYYDCFDSLSLNTEITNVYEKIITNENLASLIVIKTEYHLDTLITGISIFRKYGNKIRKIYTEIYKINMEYILYGLPPEDIVMSVPEIVGSLISVVLRINTNVEKAEVYINNKFIAYAEPDVVITANHGKYLLTVKSDGYDTYEEEVIVLSNKEININLNENFFKSSGLSVSAEFIFMEDMFRDNFEENRISTWYYFTYYFSFLNIHRLEVGGSFLILNVIRSNTAYFYNNSFPFQSEIPFMSFSLFADLKYSPVFSQFHWINPFAGGGIGFTFMEIDDFSENVTNFDAKKTYVDMSFNVSAGVLLNVTRVFSVILSFRYVWLGKLSYYELAEFYIPQEQNSVNKIDEYYRGYLLSIGVRVNL